LYIKSGIKIEFRKPVSSSRNHVAKSHTTFSNSDLPTGTLKHWQGIYLLAWYQYLGTLKNPWSLGDLLPEAQRIWDEVFPQHPKTLAATGEPIFYLVIFLSDILLCN